MRPNFDISLPSIPGKNIKFKIQDIKQTAFGSKKQRFHENKRGLTKKFIESFNNFHQNKDLERLEQETQASETNSRISIKSTTFQREKAERNFRQHIPEDRKYINSLYEKTKSYETPVLKECKFDKGFTFNRADKGGKFNDEQQLKQDPDKLSKKFVTDNYYFTSTVMETPSYSGENDLQIINKRVQQSEKKREKPSAVFKNETRERVWQKSYKNEVPGPGFYKQQEFFKRQTRGKKSASQKQTCSSQQNNYKKLKNIITSIVGEQKQEDDQSTQIIDQSSQRKQKTQHMFIVDDRDRFGNQKYPIAARLNVPGPGTYEVMDRLQDQARKVALVEQQRKLLKEWFNN